MCPLAPQEGFPSIETSSSSPPKMWCPCVCKLYHLPRLLWCYYVKAAHLVAPGIIYNLDLQSNPGMRVCVHPLSSLSLFVRWDGSGASSAGPGGGSVPLEPSEGYGVRGAHSSMRGCRVGASLAASDRGAVSWAVMSAGRPTRVHPLQALGCLLPAECRWGVSSPRKLGSGNK